jgi:ATP-dependent RNA helicase RhlE
MPSLKGISCSQEKTELIIKLITEGNWKQILVHAQQVPISLPKALIGAGIQAYNSRNKGQGQNKSFSWF